MTTRHSHDLSPGRIDGCQICGSTGLLPILSLGHHAPCDSLLWPEQLHQLERTYPLDLVRCPDCGLVQIDYVVAPEELFFPEYPYRSGITSTLVGNLRSTGPTIMQRYGISGGLAIDIGSNDGTLLSGFKDAGMHVIGVEPTNIAKIANETGIETIQEFFSEDLAKGIVAKRGTAQVVTAANMFAHVSKLGSLIRGVEALLDRGGLFVTESHYLMDLIDTVQYDSIYHEHLKYYSVRSIIRLFDYYEFTVVDVDRIPNYGGSIRVYAMKGKGHPVRESVSHLLAEEERLGLHDGPLYDRFVAQVRQSKIDLQKLLVEARAEGCSVVGVGSPGRAATLLSYCNIDPDMIPYIAEQSTSLKLGLYMPGSHIPIADEARMFAEQPDYAVMLSWHYWEPIVAKLRAKGLRARIVLPLPTVRILES
ncbi:MAG: class I SAM-dependent methyltransferase [Sulfuritalea sp.]|nr:class I SAM-dependent methyltransferase [Sulfuritalea sp.]